MNVLKKVCSKYDRNKEEKESSSSCGGSSPSQRKRHCRVSLLQQLRQGVVEAGTERTFQLRDRPKTQWIWGTNSKFSICPLIKNMCQPEAGKRRLEPSLFFYLAKISFWNYPKFLIFKSGLLCHSEVLPPLGSPLWYICYPEIWPVYLCHPPETIYQIFPCNV